MWMIQTTAVLLCLVIRSTAVTETGDETALTFLQNYRYGSVYRYQARCTLPCNGSYRPGTFSVTVSLDKICSNFESFGNFKASQTTPSSVWYLNNTNWINSNSQGKCQFDLQFEHTPQQPVPTGTCKLGWETPTKCLTDDETEPVLYEWMTCFDVVIDKFDMCYNQTIFSQCCQTCNDYRLNLDNCPFGDLEPWRCTSLRDDHCYESDIEQNCCKTCHDRAQANVPKIENCPYGDRDPYFCSTIEDYDCYKHADTCCYMCYWVADQNMPDCLYGNRRPEVCENVSTFDCYNKTVYNACCGWCSELRNDQAPDCLYGDKAERCNSIERRDCYRQSVVDTCCDTCVQLADNSHPECPYGDRRDCWGTTVDNCTWTEVQDDCCQTCRFLEENNCIANSPYDEPTKCYDIESRDCYNANTRSQCCFTCYDYYDQNTHLGESCKYGDRTPNQCWGINNTDCYSASVEQGCCETCSYYTMPNLPTNCRYGDKDYECHQMAPYECYDAGVLSTCCETCMYYDQTDELGAGCRFGDRKSDCYKEGPHICYDGNERRECCKYCQNSENPDNVGCEFGDKEPSCGDIEAKDCYSMENKCCASCPFLVIEYNIDNCKYGDRADCSGISDADCYNADTSFKCCKTCWLRSNGNQECAFGDAASDCPNIQPWECYFREFDCCETCKSFLSTVTDLSYCKYGDRSDRCIDITADQCYNQDTQYHCCETCFKKRRNDLPDTCLYGDKISTCRSTQHHSSECYTSYKRDACCETCLQIKTDNQNCEYGDKLVMCDDVPNLPYLCYNNTLQNKCCSTCPSLADYTIPGCEYGDIYRYCDENRCDQYPKFRLQECCYTCGERHSSTTEYTTEPTSPTSPDTTTEETKDSNTLPIVGGAIGGVLVVAAIIIAVCFVMRRNKNKAKSRNKYPHLTDLNAHHPQSRNAPSYLENRSRNPPVGKPVGNPGYNSRAQSNVTQPNRAPPRRQSTKENEEVYDYIDDRDVRSLPSIKKPSVPDREGADVGYLEPTQNGNAQYFNPAYDNDASKDNHTYHVLQKDEQANAEREYMAL